MLCEAPILIGAAIPLATLLICWIARAGLSAAVLAGLWTSAGIVLRPERRRWAGNDFACRGSTATSCIAARDTRAAVP